MTDDAAMPSSFVPQLRAVGGVIGIALLVVLATLAVGWGSVDDAARIDYADARLKPGADHVFGTDPQGRDLLARTAQGLRQSARVSAIATVLLGGFAVAVGVAGLLLRRLLPDTRATRWGIGIAAAVIWISLVRVMWRLPFVSDGRPWSQVHAVHDVTLAQVTGRLFAATCMCLAAAIALEGLRWGFGHAERTRRHVLGAVALLFGLGCASTAPLDDAGMLGLGAPRGSLPAIAVEGARYTDDWWLTWLPIAVLLIVLVACALVGTWLMAYRSSDVTVARLDAWEHPAAITLATAGIAVAIWRQVRLPWFGDYTAGRLQLVATLLVVGAIALLVGGRLRRGARGVDLGTATWFVIGAAAAVLLHLPALDAAKDRADDLGDAASAIARVVPGRN